MTHANAIDYLVEKMQNRLNTLKLTKEHQYNNNPKLEIEMCEALLDVFCIARNNKGIRWFRAPLKSNQNLAWVVKAKVNPILAKTFDLSGTALLDIDFIKNSLNEKSMKLGKSAKSERSQIDNLVQTLRKNNFLDESEKKAIAHLSDSLLALQAHYWPKEKIRKEGDGPYCLYCFRERYRFDTDTCDKHRDEKRTDGKRYLDRYIKIKDAIRSFEVNNKLLIFDAMVLEEFRKKKIGLWHDTQDQINWIKEVLFLIYAYDKNDEGDKRYINDKANLLFQESDAAHKEAFPHWPSSLNGMMYRYQAYTLAKIRKPKNTVIEKLNKVWSGQKVIDVAKIYKVQRIGLQKAVIDWRDKINLLRSDKVPDELIKVALGLEFLPIRKSGGAANKKSP
jgi:hypothetical protein